MNTLELAEGLRRVASFLDSRPTFDLDGSVYVTNSEHFQEARLYFYEKEKFIAISKIFGTAVKKVTEGEYAEFTLKSSVGPVSVSISRDKVCKKVVKFECDPLFTAEEINAL
jgi:hypothetical protein